MYLLGDLNVPYRDYQILCILVGLMLLPLEKGRRWNWSCSAAHKKWLSWRKVLLPTPCRKHLPVLQGASLASQVQGDILKTEITAVAA